MRRLYSDDGGPGPEDALSSADKAAGLRPDLACGHRETETMPTNACQWFYDCKGCGDVLRPKPGDCCVYCSYGTVPCPPIQAGDGCCG